MQTEINGDWKGYLHRFKLPEKKVVLLPLKRFGICLMIQVVLGTVAVGLAHSCASKGGMLLWLVVSSMIIGAYLYAVYKEFWTVVLEAAKGFWADLLMWVYYIVCSAMITVVPVMVVDYIMNRNI